MPTFHLSYIFGLSRLFGLSVCALLLLPLATQATETEATLDAYAAGYKAGFTCSAIFNAGKSIEAIRDHELTGIYPLIADRVAALADAQINHHAKQVRVPYSDTMPPRIAQWRPHLGCVHLPTGATDTMADLIPTIALPFNESAFRTDNGKPWQQHAALNGTSGNAALDQIFADAMTGRTYGADAVTSALLVASKDAILAEWYREYFTPVTSQRTWSVAKSIAASVIGAAVEQGLITVDAPSGIPEWQHPADPRRAITLENLLHMASGLDSNVAGNRTDRLYMGGGRVTDTATTTALEAIPGSRWKYANNDTLLATRALRAALGDEDKALTFPFTALLLPLGMDHTVLETDWEGNFILSSQVWTTARDLARLGVLYLNDGVWNGTRLLPKGWAAYVATPAPAQPPLKRNANSNNPGYGAQWWLFNDRFPDIPDDSYAALGNRGQFLMIVPSRGLVIIRRGYDPAGGAGFDIARFTHDVLKALE